MGEEVDEKIKELQEKGEGKRRKREEETREEGEK